MNKLGNSNLEDGRPIDGPRRREWQPRFGLGSMLLVMLVCSVLAAGASYLIRSLDEHSRRLPFFMFIIAGPALLMIAVSLIRGAILWFQRRR